MKRISIYISCIIILVSVLGFKAYAQTPVTGAKITGVTATASSNAAWVNPSLAVDGNIYSEWKSATTAPQWIEINLGSVKNVSHLVLRPYSLSRDSVHQIYAGTTANPTTKIMDFTGSTNNVFTVTFTPVLQNVQYIRILTVSNQNGPVGWYEIEIYDAPAATNAPVSTIPPTAPPNTIPTPNPTYYFSGKWVTGQTKSLPGIFKNGIWYLKTDTSNTNTDVRFAYGSQDDYPIVCDWDGDGVSTIGVLRNDNGSWRWFIRNTNTGGAADYNFVFGAFGSTPVCGDWDGDKKQSPGTVNDTGIWSLRNSLSAGNADITFNYGGVDGEEHVVGDWTGQGKDLPGVIRGNMWFLRDSLTGGIADRSFLYGLATDMKVVGDWDGDGIFTPGAVRGLSWLLRNATSSGSADTTITFDSATGVTPAISPLPTIPESCVCNTENICDNSCSFEKDGSSEYASQIKCSRETVLDATPNATLDKDAYCRRPMRTAGDADGNRQIDDFDYLYYVRAVNGGKIPNFVNPDFNGDGVVSPTDRVIIVKKLNQLPVPNNTPTDVPNTTITPTVPVPTGITVTPTTPALSTAVINTNTNPWTVTLNGTNISAGMTVQLFDSGTQWGGNIPLTVSNSTMASFQTPSMLPPSNCWQQWNCTLTVKIVNPTTNVSSNVVSIPW